MGKPNFSFQKRQKELARQRKKEEKRQRKLEKASSQPPGEEQDQLAVDESAQGPGETPAGSDGEQHDNNA